ncbi:MAG: cupin domain-containing protein [Tannerellaceae bacterium]|jgi:mannose-6-phosphate isomerase-like protein (cupin superfamily)|nr:cupin domain-containing protein [Tannerellaceae bacterium]
MKTTKLLTIGIGLLLSFPFVLNSQNKQVVPGQVESYIDRFELRPSDKNANGWAHYYIPKGMGDTLTVKMSCVYIGTQTHAPHTHKEDEAFYIVRGPVNFHINGVERVLNTGDFVYTPSGSSHNIQRVNETDTIKYLVLKRETLKAVDQPYRVAKPDYVMDDCCTYPARHPQWTDPRREASLVLLDKNFAAGFQVVMHRVTKNSRVFQNEKPRQPGQLALYILEGEADISLDGQIAQLTADNTLYCPRNSVYTLKKRGNAPLLFLSITTE